VKTIYTYEAKRQELIRRLRKIEGQVKGIARMIEEGQYCLDILIQVAATRAALHKVGMMVLEGHVHGCVTRAVSEGAGDEVIDELMKVIEKYTKG
jgi:DNA-binding FrmR family transcriptional regulator